MKRKINFLPVKIFTIYKQTSVFMTRKLDKQNQDYNRVNNY